VVCRLRCSHTPKQKERSPTPGVSSSLRRPSRG